MNELEPHDKEKARRRFESDSEKVREEDLDETLHKGEEKFHRLEEEPPSALQRVWQDLKLLLALLRDYRSGAYRDIPWRSVAAIISAIAYFAAPIDVIPDFLAVFGFIDDAFVLGLCLKYIEKDLEKYRRWREEK